MRRFYPSRTMRNFSLYVSPEIDLRLGPYGFHEIVKRVHHSMSLQVDRRELARQIARNVRAQRNPLIRIMPLFLKDLLFSYVRERMGERPYSGVLTNLGRIVVPEEVTPHIERVWGHARPESTNEDKLRDPEFRRRPLHQLWKRDREPGARETVLQASGRCRA